MIIDSRTDKEEARIGGRRSAIKKLLSLPIIGYFAPKAFADSNIRDGKTPSDSRSPHRTLGITVLRFVNTAELWNKRIGKTATNYLNIEPLGESLAVIAMKRSKIARSRGLGAPLISRLNFKSAEIVPGWRLTLTLDGEGSEYRAILEDTTGEALGAIATDNVGLIYEIPRSAGIHQAKSLAGFPGATPLGGGPVSKPAGALGRAAQYLASMVAAPMLEPWCCWWCCCACSEANRCCIVCDPNGFWASSPDSEYPCCNCGCEGHVWFCTQTTGGPGDPDGACCGS